MSPLPLAVVAVLTAGTKIWATRWRHRGLRFGVPLAVTAAAAAAASLTVAAVTPGGYGEVAAAAAAAATWLAVLATSADLGDRRVPYEPCWLVTALGAALGLAVAPAAGAIAALIALLGTVVIPACAGRLLRRDGRDAIGRGDLRLLTALVSCLSWWLGAHPLLLGLLAACLIAGAARTIRALLRRGRRWQAFAPALCLGLAITCAHAAREGHTACALVTVVPPTPAACNSPWWTPGDAAPASTYPPP